MKKFKTYGKIALAAILLAGCSMTGSDWNREVEIVNKTDVSIVAFYGSNVGTDSWEENILAGSTVPPRRSVMIDFDDGTGYCNFDFRAEFSDGDVVVKHDVDVCAVWSVTYE